MSTNPNRVVEADRTLVTMIKETELGVTPVTGNAQTMRVTSEALEGSAEFSESGELEPTRQRTSSVVTSEGAGGSLNGEMSYGTFDPLILAAIGADAYSSELVSSNNCSIDNTSYTFSALNLLSDFTVGTFITVTGTHYVNSYGVKVNDGIKLITGIDENTGRMSVLPAPINEPSGQRTLHFAHSGHATNGLSRASFSMEKTFTQKNVSQLFRGMTVNTLEIGADTGSLATFTTDLIGVGSSVHENSSGLDPAVVVKDANTNDIMSTASSTGIAVLDGKITTVLTQLGLNFSNNAEAVKVIGSTDSIDVRLGKFTLDISVTALFTSYEIYNTFKANRRVSLAFSLGNSRVGYYGFYIPEVVLQSPTASASGTNTSLEMSFTAQAVISSDIGRKTLIVTRIKPVTT